MSITATPRKNDLSVTSTSFVPTSQTKLPLALKVGYTAFMAVLVPYYWIEYGPTNFVYFCDIALFLTLIAVWTERPLFASMAAVGITIPQFLWQVDFLGNLINLPVTGMTDYMFNEEISLLARGLSFFHFWLPILLIGIVLKLGYDHRALWSWTLIAWAAMLVSYFFLPAPGDALEFVNQPRNVNYVYGMSPDAPQHYMPTWAWLAMMLAGLPAVVYLPTHSLLRWVAGNDTRNA
ncbi:hypothetical protein [Rhodopirellula sallentina]|uniref:Putative membrane protein n=1 Tax=Rhodopirellula sallentina SM41 TaxID=1263870 RepID=M5TYT1_9BACT|nr:hypothetical protein [Rhodopirellula sallentina]EMI54355.1 putative membrane protein [Rhodopirellula sallentina SM41]